MKKALKIIRNILLGFVGLIAGVVLAVVLYLHFSVNDYYKASEKGFKIPELNEAYIPQGIWHDEDRKLIFLTGYMNDGSASPIYALDEATGDVVKKVSMAYTDGQPFPNHAGGLVTYKDKLYVAGGFDQCLYEFEVEDILNAEDGALVPYTSTLDLHDDNDGIGIAWITINNDVMYAGEFYREQNYPTDERHHFITPSGVNHGLAVAIDMKSETPEIKEVYSLPDLAQGVALDNRYIYVSTSYGMPKSKIYTFDRTLLKSEGKYDLLGNNLPLYILEDSSLASVKEIAPMSEEIDIINNKLYVMCESASDKYIFGKLTGHYWCYSTDVNYFADGDRNVKLDSAISEQELSALKGAELNITADAINETINTDSNVDLDDVVMDEATGIDSLKNDYYMDYKEVGGDIAYLTGVSLLNDGNYNQSIYAGIQTYAHSAGVSYSYYIPKDNTQEAYKAVLDKAIDSGCKLVVCSGYHYDELVGEYQEMYSDISFLVIDSSPNDSNGNDIPPAKNVHCVAFCEEESSYLAGYMSVMDGYRHFGYIGGESLEPVKCYGYGYLQGIEAAAKALGCVDDIKVDYWYSESFLPNDEIKNMADSWYKDGCEVIFSCGGAIYESVLESAEENDGYIIGVDTDQSDISDRVVTSALKGTDRAVIVALDDYFAYDGWSDELGGKIISYGLKEWCGGLPTASWKFKNVTEKDFLDVYLGIRDGSILVSDDTSKISDVGINCEFYK